MGKKSRALKALKRELDQLSSDAYVAKLNEIENEVLGDSKTHGPVASGIFDPMTLVLDTNAKLSHAEIYDAIKNKLSEVGYDTSPNVQIVESIQYWPRELWLRITCRGRWLIRMVHAMHREALLDVELDLCNNSITAELLGPQVLRSRPELFRLEQNCVQRERIKSERRRRKEADKRVEVLRPVSERVVHRLNQRPIWRPI